MDSIFSLDSKPMRFLSRVADLLILNFLYLISCIPIFTAGAATAALYTVCFRLGTDREGVVYRDYFRAFRQNFRQATYLWLLMLLICGGLIFNILFCQSLPGALRYAFVFFLILLILVTYISGLVFPLLSQFENTCNQTLRNAVLLSFSHWSRTFTIMLLNLFPFMLLLLYARVFMWLMPLFTMLYFSVSAYFSAWILRPVFRPYMTPADESDS